MPTPDPRQSDPANWSAFGIYSCKSDPRLVVPKRRRAFGWTINVGHRLAVPTLAAILVSAIALPRLLG